ncbi:MAG TPA: DUF2442 domain-containing protein [Pyrinomonadaceae bacterium]|nr:DUF2442 domain-containing protein [Pyrinomonadaceae bacterium]
MGILALAADERVADVRVAEDELSVRLMDGRTISVPLVWYPRLLNATEAQRKNWQIVGGGYGIHWDEIDEDLSTEGLLRGAPAPRQGVAKIQLPPKHVEGALNNKPKDDEQLVVEISEDENEKGFLDHLTEGEEAAQELTNIISVIDKETRNIAAKFEQHTSNINRLSSVPGGVKASDFRKIAMLSASDMNTFSTRIEDVLPKFEQNTQTLEESFSA